MPLDPNGPLDPSGHLDTFARDHLPPRDLWPVMEYGTVPELEYPRRLNAADELLDRMVEKGFGERPCLRTDKAVWTYRDLLEKANRIANVLVQDLGLVPGNRVLLRAANTPMLSPAGSPYLRSVALQSPLCLYSGRESSVKF